MRYLSVEDDPHSAPTMERLTGYDFAFCPDEEGIKTKCPGHLQC
jgi:hypothetical protein